MPILGRSYKICIRYVRPGEQFAIFSRDAVAILRGSDVVLGGGLLDLGTMLVGAGDQPVVGVLAEQAFEAEDGIGDDGRVEVTDVRCWIS